MIDQRTVSAAVVGDQGTGGVENVRLPGRCGLGDRGAGAEHTEGDDPHADAPAPS